MDAQLSLLALDDSWRKGPWIPQEDKILIEHVKLHGEGRWNSVSRLTGLKRSGKSCRLRWVNYLRPDLKGGKITPHEEAIIIELHALWGNRWSTIARSLPGRTDNEIKNYWRTHFKRSKPPANKKRAGARFVPQEQPQQQPDYEMKANVVPEVEATAMVQEMQELAYMYPTFYVQQGGGGTTVDDSEDETWGNLWNLDDVRADGEKAGDTAMQKNQVVYW